MTTGRSVSRDEARETAQRIFVVEDSPIIREALVAVLDHADDGRMVVGTADTEESAVERIADTEPDVAIIDIHLREGSGMGVLARLSSLDEAPPIRIVYTNRFDRALLEDCHELGATHVLNKGDVRELLEALDDPNPHRAGG
jgi:DNA-binding NarL/FixJ family response regulator